MPTTRLRIFHTLKPVLKKRADRIHRPEATNPRRNFMSIENKGVRSLANAQSLVEDENGGQDHCYSEDASGAKPTQGEFEGKGENDERVAKASKATGGRHVTSKNGLDVAKERQKHVA